jgi:tRNA nucleotidyltransferase/poly(A) polymerase
LETFIDDPLRMLRIIRFACRYNFLVSDEAIEEAKNGKIEKAFEEKLSRERVGAEMEKILSSDDPIGGFSLIHEMGMRDYVFTVPTINAKQSKKLFNQFKVKLKEYSNPEPIKWTEDQWKNSLFRCRLMFKLSKKNDLPNHVRTALMFSLISTVVSDSWNYEETKFFIERLVMCSFKLPMKLSQDVSNLIFNSKVVKKFILSEKIKYEDSMEEMFKIYIDVVKSNLLEIGYWLRSSQTLWEPSAWLGGTLETTGTEMNEYIYQKDFKLLRSEGNQGFISHTLSIL